MVRWLCRALDLLHVPAVLEALWRLMIFAGRLRPEEAAFAASVLGPQTLRYRAVRIGERGILPLVFKANKRRAFTLFHTISLPRAGGHERTNTAILVHEMVHVLQFEKVGSVYIYEALRAQRTEGYGYGGWEQLVSDRAKGKRFGSYNREQQGQIVEDYCATVVAKGIAAGDPIGKAYEPFIEDARRGLI